MRRQCFAGGMCRGDACLVCACSGTTANPLPFDSGFNNLSHFNRVFKEIMGQTPRQYQQAMLDFQPDA